MEDTIANNTSEETSSIQRPQRHHRKPDDGKGSMFVMRQVFNIIFMIGAIVGVFLYIKVNSTMGAIIIIIAMAFKMAECVLRFRKK